MLARSLVIALFVGAGLLTATCRAEPPESTPSLEELRREIAELRQTVADLRERIQQLEYERLPRMRSETEGAAPPEAAPPSWLRFPIAVERAMMLPVGRPIGRPLR